MLCDKLKINDGKTEFVVIGTRQQLFKVHVDSLTVGDAQVSPVQSVKNLGTYIDSNMSRQVNINNTCKAAYYDITNVRRIRKYLSNQATQTLVHALIIGRIDYCNSILYGLPAKQIAKLQRLQKIPKSRLLGMTVDEKLTWTPHMLELKKSFAKKLGLLKKSRFLPRNVRQDLYFKVILPSVTYGLILWGSCCNSDLFQSLERLHCRAARLLSFAERHGIC